MRCKYCQETCPCPGKLPQKCCRRRFSLAVPWTLYLQTEVRNQDMSETTTSKHPRTLLQIHLTYRRSQRGPMNRVMKGP